MSERKTIHVDNLFVDPNNVRKGKTNTRNLIESVEKHGILNPLTVREKEGQTETIADTGKGTPGHPAGEQEYWVVAGRRRLIAAGKAGIQEIDCVVKDIGPEEALDTSFDENQVRDSVTQFDLAKAVKNKFEYLEEDLVGEDETVECPECGKEYSGAKSLERHIAQADNHDDSSELFTSQRQIYDEIADSSSFDWRTVQRLIQVAQIPKQFQAFVKTPEERNSSEEDYVEDIVGVNFTFVNQENDSTLSQKTIDFAQFVKNNPPRLVEKTLSKINIRNKDTSDTTSLFRSVSNAWEEWEEELDREGITESIAHNNSIKGKKPKFAEDDDSGEEEGQQEEQQEKDNREESDQDEVQEQDEPEDKEDEDEANEDDVEEAEEKKEEDKEKEEKEDREEDREEEEGKEEEEEVTEATITVMIETDTTKVVKEKVSKGEFSDSLMNQAAEHGADETANKLEEEQ